ncbi:MAG: hypothetical protein Q9M28_06540 [Mariprofundaceae bacterium]|nr:hypothetical protein [Mariprofundaceae bacterium]
MPKQIYIFLCFLLLTSPGSAFGCGTCTLAYVDYVLPPVHVWLLFPIFWFVAASIISSQDPLQPRLLVRGWLSVVLALSMLTLEIALGVAPFLSFFLLLGPLQLSIQLLRKKTRQRWDQNHIFHYSIVSSIGMTALCLLIAYSGWIHATRTDSDYVISWGLSGPGISIIHALKQEPIDLKNIRKLVQEANHLTAAKLAGTLATHGQHQIDFPILLQAREQAVFNQDVFDQALTQLIGIELETGSSTQEWQAAYDQKFQED